MLRKLLTLRLLLALWIAPALSLATPADQAFQRLADEFLKGYLAFDPVGSTGLGLHEYDGLAPDYSRASLDAERKRLQHFEERLRDFENGKSLSPAANF